MTITKTQEKEKLTISINGRLDTTTSPILQDELILALETETHVQLDFTNLIYVSSAGLRLLLMGQKAAKAKNATMTIACVSEDVMEVLDMTGFSDILTIVKG